jgi:thioredoxin
VPPMHWRIALPGVHRKAHEIQLEATLARINPNNHWGAQLMSILTITEENFDQAVENHPILVLDFWATWCGPCRSFAPVFEAAAAKHQDTAFGKIDTDAEQGLANAFGIRTVPTLMVIRENVMVVRESGALPASSLEKVIEHVRLLNMDDVHNELAALEGEADAIDH